MATRELDEFSLEELRGLGHELEPLLDRRVRARTQEELLGLVDEALNELLDLDFEAFLAVAVRNDLLEDSESDGEAEGEHEAAESKRSDSGPPGKAAAGVSYAIQIREHTTRAGLEFGRIIINPDPEIRKTFIHASLNQAGVKKLVAQGYKISEKFSNRG